MAADTGTNVLGGNLTRAFAQLNGTLINPDTSQPYTNSAIPGPNPDGSYDIDTVVNYDDQGNSGSGNFPGSEPFPGLVSTGNTWFSTEALFFLDLPTGYYRFGVNSDDGFGTDLLPPQGVAGSAIRLGEFNDNRGAADTVFDFQVQTAGLYPFRLVFFQSTGYASEEFFSVNLATGQKTLINDLVDPNAIKSYRVLKPRILGIVRSDPDVVIDWAYGTPPFQVQTKANLNAAPWTNNGAPTTNRTARVQMQPGATFIRVVGQP